MKFIFALVVEFLVEWFFAALLKGFLDLLISVPRRLITRGNDLPNHFAIQTGPSADGLVIFSDE